MYFDVRFLSYYDKNNGNEQYFSPQYDEKTVFSSQYGEKTNVQLMKSSDQKRATFATWTQLKTFRYGSGEKEFFWIKS